ncbi:MAG: hypothetical protein AB1656_26425 [Candidatus Omnitrophota bacterium]
MGQSESPDEPACSISIINQSMAATNTENKMMKAQQIKSNIPQTLLKPGTAFTDLNGTEWTIIVSAGDGTAAVESEDEAGEYSNGVVYLSEEGDTYGANFTPEYIVKNGSWYKNQSLNAKKDEFVLKKNGAFRKKDKSSKNRVFSPGKPFEMKNH